MFARAISAILLAGLLATASAAKGQSPTPTSTPETVRVTVSMNADGSRTVYEFDPLHHKAKATTTDSNGKAVGTIRYTLDDAGRFVSGEIYGPHEQLRFKTLYKVLIDLTHLSEIAYGGAMSYESGNSLTLRGRLF